MVVKDMLEPILEALFHNDSYGYRPPQICARCPEDGPASMLAY
nr:hypothetical protein SYMBAF_210003 [Serratia symbiotica]